MRLPPVIGHRGAAARAPENTLAGFRRAAELGTAWVELDVQLSADGVPVVIHDARVDRTTDGRGRVAAMTAEQLRRLDAGAWFSPDYAGETIPTLAEAVETILGLGLGLNIEIKAARGQEAETARRALAAAAALWPKDREPPLVSSFDRTALTAAREAMPDWPRGLLVGRVPRGCVELARRLGCASVHVNQAMLSARGVASVREAGLRLAAYTVNEPERARWLWGLGVEALFTDAPDILLPVAPRR